MSENITIAIADYLAYKRALGRKFQTEEATLRMLVRFTDDHSITGLQQLIGTLLEEFVASRQRKRTRSFNHLVGVVGGFLDWTVAQGLMPASPMPRLHRRVTDERLPFILGPDQVRQVLAAAAALPDNPRGKDRAVIYHAIFALCYGLGLRVGEACALRIGDVDTNRQLLVVHGGKFGKERLVPHGPHIGQLLTRSLNRTSGNDDAPLFSFDGHHPVNTCTASRVFHELVSQLGFPVLDGVCPPRLHSLRHSFAVGCLLRWYREDVDPATKLVHLSTFMGHVSPEGTDAGLGDI